MLKTMLTTLISFATILAITSTCYASAAQDSASEAIADLNLEVDESQLQSDGVVAVTELDNPIKIKTTYYLWKQGEFEINLNKGGDRKNEAWTVSPQAKGYVSQLANTAQQIVNEHNVFRIKHLAMAWNHQQVTEFNEANPKLHVPFFVRLQFEKSDGIIEQGTQFVIGHLVVQKAGDRVLVNVAGFDQSSLLEKASKLAQNRYKILFSDNVNDEDYDSMRIRQALTPVLEGIINDDPELIKKLAELFDKNCINLF